MAKVKFWTRVSRDTHDEWKLVEGEDFSGVPLVAWKTLNKQFWARKMRGEFYPLDELEAYQIACGEMVRASGKAALHKATLHKATLTTYLVGAAFNNLRKYRERSVGRARMMYRAVGERGKVAAENEGAGAHEEDREDREWAERGAKSLNVRAYVEGLPDCSARERLIAMRQAKACVDETLLRLDPDTRRAFRAWLDADGVWSDAAKRYGCSRPWYYALFKNRWAPAFRRACDWRW